MAPTENVEQCNTMADPSIYFVLSHFGLSSPCGLRKLESAILDWSTIAGILEFHQAEKRISPYLESLQHEWTLERDSTAIVASLAFDVFQLSIRVTGDAWWVNLLDMDYVTLSPLAVPPGWTVTPFQDLNNECSDWLSWLEEFEVRFDESFDHLEVIYNRCEFETALWQKLKTGRQGMDLHGGSDLDSVSVVVQNLSLSTEPRVRNRANNMPLLD